MSWSRINLAVGLSVRTQHMFPRAVALIRLQWWKNLMSDLYESTIGKECLTVSSRMQALGADVYGDILWKA